jgi:lipoteichoic acid synthase
MQEVFLKVNFLKEKLINKNRIGIFILAILLFWAKTMLAYYTEFDLGVSGAIQTFILWINPFATSMVLLSLSLYIKDTKKSGNFMLLMYFIISLLLYANVLYYREFADFMTLSTIMGNIGLEGGSNVSFGLITSFFVMLRVWDFVYWIDFAFLTWLIHKKTKAIETNEIQTKKPFYKRYAVAASLSGIALLFGNLVLAETDRPQLLTRTFDRNYIVKYLGVNFYTGYDAYQTVRNNRIRAQADEGDLKEVFEFAKENHTMPNEEFFGLAEGRNVITLVFESAQQFIVDYQLEDEEGNMHEVTPFLNNIYHDDATIRFDNFFHQTGQGKSSDAEVLAENSLFGLPEGSAFQTLGSDNIFHAAPKILGEEKGYTSAAFHGNTGTFWNRTGTYRNFGYDYFFDSNYYDMSEGRTLDYGLKDKLFFNDSVEYIEQLPQPFYSKFITLTNHFPYPLEEENASIPKATTQDDTVNSYFQTVRYTDEAFEEFFNWLKDSGLYENSIIVIYGDHYGNSNMRNPHLAPLLGHESEEWGNFENTQMQRVPLMFHIPGYTGGETYETYGGQVDLLPTLLHLLGVETDSYLFMGQDLLSEENEQLVPLRNGNVLTPEYHFIGSNIYDAETGEILDETLTEEELAELTDLANHGRERLMNSDNLLSLDLLRFYQPVTLESWMPNDYQYQDQMEHLRNLPNSNTSLINQHGGKSTVDMYETNAPELEENQEELVDEPEESENQVNDEELNNENTLENE